MSKFKRRVNNWQRIWKMLTCRNLSRRRTIKLLKLKRKLKMKKSNRPQVTGNLQLKRESSKRKLLRRTMIIKK